MICEYTKKTKPLNVYNSIVETKNKRKKNITLCSID